MEKRNKGNAAKMLTENKLLLQEIDHLKRQLTEAKKFRARTPTRRYTHNQFPSSLG
jgi:hypothetical protein